MFHLCLVILPPRPEASVYIPIAERIFHVLGDSDCRTAFCVVGNEFIAKSVLGDAEQRVPRRSSTPTASWPAASASPTCPPSSTCARTRRWVPRPRAGTPLPGRRWRRNWPRRWRGACPPWPRRVTLRPLPVGPSDPICELNFNSVQSGLQTPSMLAPRQTGSLGFPAVRTGGPPVYGRVVVGYLSVCCAQRRVQQGPIRHCRRSPHMNRRALKLVIVGLMIATLGAIAAPGVAIADPIADKQAQAQQLATEISANAEKLAALNEQMNSTQNELDQANADIANADALVDSAKAKTKELRAEVARRAATVYTQSGSNSGVEDLDAAERPGPHLEAEVQLARRAARQRDRLRPRQGEAAGHGAQVRRRGRPQGRPGQAGRAPGAEGQARRRSGRPREAQLAGHR